mmetsp:Transcript_59977/g.194430  ORF Transcript_59977/g.194430 Transcript_59977/m.194430 type:complete len:279 (-) Transcript_59977:1731-2567(-)
MPLLRQLHRRLRLRVRLQLPSCPGKRLLQLRTPPLGAIHGEYHAVVCLLEPGLELADAVGVFLQLLLVLGECGVQQLLRLPPRLLQRRELLPLHGLRLHGGAELLLRGGQRVLHVGDPCSHIVALSLQLLEPRQLSLQLLQLSFDNGALRLLLPQPRLHGRPGRRQSLRERGDLCPQRPFLLLSCQGIGISVRQLLPGARHLRLQLLARGLALPQPLLAVGLRTLELFARLLFLLRGFQGCTRALLALAGNLGQLLVGHPALLLQPALHLGDVLDLRL